jgi:hypothetical protein
MTSHSDIFTDAYMNCRWGDNKEDGYKGSSGGGSEPKRNKPYIDFMRDFLIQYNIQSVSDLGCGDWRISHDIYKDKDIKYFGYDVYSDIIKVNQLKYPNYKFLILDIYEQRNIIQNTDLFILRDILCHWKNDEINTFLSYIITEKKCKYILICNGNYQKYDNQDIKNTGDWRPLSVKYLPLKQFNPKILFEYDVKEISLIDIS